MKLCLAESMFRGGLCMLLRYMRRIVLILLPLFVCNTKTLFLGNLAKLASLPSRPTCHEELQDLASLYKKWVSRETWTTNNGVLWIHTLSQYKFLNPPHGLHRYPLLICDNQNSDKSAFPVLQCECCLRKPEKN